MENKIQEMVKQLKAQDELLETLFIAREKTAKDCKELGIYDAVWETLYKDGKNHYTF